MGSARARPGYGPSRGGRGFWCPSAVGQGRRPLGEITGGVSAQTPSPRHGRGPEVAIGSRAATVGGAFIAVAGRVIVKAGRPVVALGPGGVAQGSAAIGTPPSPLGG